MPKAAATERSNRSQAVVAWLRLMRVQQKMERAAMEDLRRWDLSVPQFDVLAHVGAVDGITQQELAEARLTTKGNLSQILDNMESCGLIERERDGRSKRVRLSARGRALLAEALPLHEAAIAARFCALQANEQAHLRKLLRRLDKSL